MPGNARKYLTAWPESRFSWGTFCALIYLSEIPARIAGLLWLVRCPADAAADRKRALPCDAEKPAKCDVYASDCSDKINIVEHSSIPTLI